MKKFSALILVTAIGSTALLGFSIVPAAATQGGGVIPSVCAKADTKTQHPDWYRDGGYCVTPETGYLGFHKY